jgi:hypothetical protein
MDDTGQSGPIILINDHVQGEEKKVPCPENNEIISTIGLNSLISEVCIDYL